METLKTLAAFLITAGLGSLPALLITAVTSWINRQAARDQLEIARLRQHEAE